MRVLCRHCGSTVKLSFAKVARPGLVISKRSLASESGRKLISSFHNEPEVYVYDLECCKRGVDAVASTFSKAGVDHVVRWVPCCAAPGTLCTPIQPCMAAHRSDLRSYLGPAFLQASKILR